MFSGIVQCIAEVREFTEKEGGGVTMDIVAPLPVERFEIGASVAHSGACMTVVRATSLDAQKTEFTIDVSPESLAKTTMSLWRKGSMINLETSLRVGDENGGHNLMGHVDGLAELVTLRQRGDHYDLRFRVDPQFMKFLPNKGSVGLDGISLTIVEPNREMHTFGVAVIPYTWQETTLHTRRVGDWLNFEIDAFARYIATYVDHVMETKG